MGRRDSNPRAALQGRGDRLGHPRSGRGGRTRTFEDLVQGQAPSPLGHAPVKGKVGNRAMG